MRVARRWAVPVVWVLTVVTAAAVGWWAGLQVASPPVLEQAVPEPIAVEVVEGTIAVEQAYGINAVWPTEPLAVNGSAGTVTNVTLSASGTRVDVGSSLYDVDLLPTFAAVGDVPSFRDLSRGTTGSDVEQLQNFLATTGRFDGTVDGVFGAATADAVVRWNVELGLGRSEVVPRGRVVFFPSLPVLAVPTKELRPGAQVSVGDELIQAVSSAPDFSFGVLPEAVSRTTEGMQVTMQVESEVWHAQVIRLGPSAAGGDGIVAVLGPASGASSICAESCAQAVAPGGEAVIPGTLVLVPETTGAEVPTAAVEIDAVGGAFVTGEDGTRIPVKVEASSGGASIVSGVSVGERVIVATPGQ